MAKNLPAHAGDARDTGSIPGSGRSPGGGNGNPLQYSWLENSMDRGGQWATAHRIAKSLTQLSDLSTHAVQTGFAGGSEGKEPACSAGDTGDMGLISGWGRSPRGGSSNPLQCPCLENPMDRGAWWATAHGSHSQTRLSTHAHVSSQWAGGTYVHLGPTRHSPIQHENVAMCQGQWTMVTTRSSELRNRHLSSLPRIRNRRYQAS